VKLATFGNIQSLGSTGE